MVSDGLQAIDDTFVAGINQCRAGQPHKDIESRMEAAGDCIPYCQCTDKECTVAFAEWPVITPAVAMNLSQNAAKLSHCRQPNKQGNLYAAEGRDEGKRQIQSSIGDNIGDFIQIATQCRLLTELPCQHTVHRIQCHADKQPDRQKPE